MSAFDKYITLQENGWYEDKEGCHHEDKPSFFHGGFLDFCGCGDPAASDLFLLSVLESLENIETRMSESVEAPFGGNEGFMYFVFYTLDKMGLTDHGGCVPGWLTEKGRDALEMLREIRGELEAEDEE